METVLKVENLRKRFDKEDVLKGVSFELNKGEVLAIIGSSGGGKTTLLRCLNQLIIPDEGKITVNGDVIFDDALGKANEKNLRTKRLHFGLVFQQFNLFPQYNVFNNLTLAARLLAKENNKKNKGSADDLKKEYERIDGEATKILERVGLKDKMKAYPCELSGGQQQRVAIARALVNEPKVLLLDEPLGALDAKLRKEMQVELKKIQQEVGITFIFVTHDQEEALSMSDTVVVMNEGKIQQIGTPVDIYNEPENRFVANFIGESNIIEGNMIRDCLVRFDDVDFPCVDKGFKENEEIEVVLRPEDIDIVEPEKGQLVGEVKNVVFKGVHYEIMVETDKRMYKIHTTDMHEVGKKVGLCVDPDLIHVMYTMEY